MREVRFISMPKLEGHFIRQKVGVWYAIFDVDSGLCGKRPEVIAKIGVDKHRTAHAANCQVCTLSNPVLRGGIGDHFS